MTLIVTLIVAYFVLSILSTLVIYAACVVSRRSGRQSTTSMTVSQTQKGEHDRLTHMPVLYLGVGGNIAHSGTRSI
jgi:hypothetical protein